VQLEITAIEEGFRLEGELDMATADGLSQLLRDAAEGGGSVKLDFSGVSFMDSSGLRALLDAATRRNGSGPVVLVNPSPQVRRVLDISIPDGTPGLEVRG
jgi:anti-sigma B factor antagonist